jgi:hypothetical protein
MNFILEVGSLHPYFSPKIRAHNILSSPPGEMIYMVTFIPVPNVSIIRKPLLLFSRTGRDLSSGIFARITLSGACQWKNKGSSKVWGVCLNQDSRHICSICWPDIHSTLTATVCVRSSVFACENSGCVERAFSLFCTSKAMFVTRVKYRPRHK